MRKILPEPMTSFALEDISIIPKIERRSVSDSKLSLSTQLTRRINIDYPFVASPMDCVINYEMASCMGRYGLVPIFYICEKNQAQVYDIIKKISSKRDIIFGIAAPTSVDFFRKVLKKDIFDKCAVVALDTLHSKPYNHLYTIEYLRKHYNHIDIISGNITNGQDCLKVINCGVDAVRVGMTSNSVNRGYEITGCGRQQAKAIYECAEIADKYNVPVIADGGIKDVSDIAKAIALGASSVMMGKMFAAMDESPCRIMERDGVKYKEYRGMSREDVIDSCMFPEGSVIYVKSKGKFDAVITEWIRRIKISVVRSGNCSLTEMRKNCTLEYYLRR